MKIPNFKTEQGSILYKDTVGRLISPRVAGILLEQAQFQLGYLNARQVLDLGCGPGTLTLPLAVGNPELAITAVDASKSMVGLAAAEAAKLGVSNIRFAQMDAGHISLAPGSFDLVLCNLAFPFFPRPEQSMSEVFSVLRPGGVACFTVPGRKTWGEFFEVAAASLGDMISLARPFLVKFSQADALPDAMHAVGFEQVAQQKTLLPFSFANGQAVLDFFGELFHLLDYATPDMKSEIADAIDRDHADGFTMHYEAVLLTAQRPS
ncbi:hypothetical protein Alches_12080 [Alicyclobacillus hesperidum subsp. aegles]|uniref:class I SAM-dependent methyltransferase n=1 Tax=Alicyclobacillus hesperidum TaxID=89784 RepID=UPI0007192492|nr:class I SAM-dependent methyltransferase [Alicyclobacillus hesperidum]GLG01169.1 hypothetical protein Alches_12080 [Alicyclobacillus hesperidum subsp. aegles]